MVLSEGEVLVDPNTDTHRTGIDQPAHVPRVWWWDLGNHGRGPTSTLAVELEILRGHLLPRGALAGSDLIVAEAQDLRPQEVRDSLKSVLKANVRPPIIPLTAAEPDNMRFLNHLPIDDLALASEPVEEVLARGLRLVRGNERRRVAEYLLRSCSDRNTVESVVEHLFFSPKPPAQVQDLAKACLVSRRTLEKRWKSAWSATAQLSLKALMDWALALRARELHQAGLPPHGTAKVLRIHQRTLERIVGRSVGLTYRQWLVLRHREVWQRVVARFLSDQEDVRVLPQE